MSPLYQQLERTEADLAAARAEIERLNIALTEAAKQISDLATRLGRAEGRLDASELVGVVEGWKARAEKAESERDEARAQVAALEAYGREKVREGMQRALTMTLGHGLSKQAHDSILAEMEKLK